MTITAMRTKTTTPSPSPSPFHFSSGTSHEKVAVRVTSALPFRTVPHFSYSPSHSHSCSCCSRLVENSTFSYNDDERDDSIIANSKYCRNINSNINSNYSNGTTKAMAQQQYSNAKGKTNETMKNEKSAEIKNQKKARK